MKVVRFFPTTFGCSCRQGPRLKVPPSPSRFRNEIGRLAITSSAGLPRCNHAKVSPVDCTQRCSHAGPLTATSTQVTFGFGQSSRPSGELLPPLIPPHIMQFEKFRLLEWKSFKEVWMVNEDVLYVDSFSFHFNKKGCCSLFSSSVHSSCMTHIHHVNVQWRKFVEH